MDARAGHISRFGRHERAKKLSRVAHPRLASTETGDELSLELEVPVRGITD
jgi:hypothetical protein